MNNIITPQDELLTFKQTSTLLKCHPNTLRLWDKNATLKAIRFGKRGDRRYRREDVMALIQKKVEKMPTPDASQGMDFFESEARTAIDRIGKLQFITASLAKTVTTQEIIDIILDAGMEAISADYGMVMLVNEEQTALTLAKSEKYPKKVLRSWKSIPLSVRTLLTDAVQFAEVRSSRRLFREEEEEEDLIIKILNKETDALSHIAIPLIADNRVIGALQLSFAKYNTFSHNDVSFMLSVGKQCAQSLERARIDEALRIGKAQLQGLLDQTPMGVYLIDADFRIRAVNPIAKPVFGEIPDLIGRDFAEVIHSLWSKEYADEIIQLFRHTLKTGEPYYTPERIEERRDLGVTEYYEWWVNRIPLPDGRDGVVCYFRDVSAQVVARIAIAESEEKYRTLFTSIDQGFAFCELVRNKKGKGIDFYVLEVNPTYEKQSGVSIEMVLGKTILQAFPALDKWWIETYAAVVDNQRPAVFEHYFENTHRWLAIQAYPSEKDRFAVLFSDITERKEAQKKVEEAYKIANAKVRNLFLEAPAIICVHRGPQHVYELSNKIHQQVIGNKDILGKPVRKAFPELVGTGIYEILDRVYSTGEPFVGKEFPVKLDRGNGKLEDAYFNFVYQPTHNSDGEIDGVLVHGVDVTEQVISRKKIEESEEKYRTLFDNIDEGFSTIEVLFDEAGKAVDYRFLETNRVHEELTGLPHTIAGMRASELMPELKKDLLERLEKVVLTGKPIRYEQQVEALGGWFDVYSTRVGGKDSRVVANVFTNITERKRREANLAFLAEVSKDLMRLTSIETTMNALGVKIGAHFRASICSFLEIDAERGLGTVTHGWHAENAVSLIGEYRIADYGTEEQLATWRSGNPFVVRDVKSDERINGEALAPYGIGSYLSIPIARDGEWRYLLSIYDRVARDWREDEIELMRELTSRIWTRLERARAEEELKVRMHQQEVVAQLGQRALAGINLEKLMDEATTLITETLQVDNSKILELLPDKKELIFRAGVGWKKGVIGRKTISAAKNNLGGYALNLRKPIIFKDLRTEKRFKSPKIHFDHGITSGFHVVILGGKGEEPYGILGACSKTPRQFTKNDTNFLQSIANILAEGIERKKHERRKDEFLSMASHELKTPLTTIKAYSQILEKRLKESADGKNSYFITNINAQTDKITLLIADLLDIGKIGAGKLIFKKKKFDFEALIQKIVVDFQYTTETHQIKKIGAINKSITGDSDRIGQVLINLLTNAIKYSPVGRDVIVTAKEDKKAVTVSVQDFGMGIPKAKQKHIFEKYFRVSDTGEQTGIGFGLGLYISAEIIKQHNGKIWVESEGSGKSLPAGRQGSTFCFTIPFRK
ncbi:MAG TPA: GAF domain-containing protein [Xanthomonadales bacterium]|nr:GAF domain-containing protein [Xanthomonadales bacterium]